MVEPIAVIRVTISGFVIVAFEAADVSVIISSSLEMDVTTDVVIAVVEDISPVATSVAVMAAVITGSVVVASPAIVLFVVTLG